MTESKEKFVKVQKKRWLELRRIGKVLTDQRGSRFYLADTIGALIDHWNKTREESE